MSSKYCGQCPYLTYDPEYREIDEGCCPFFEDYGTRKALMCMEMRKTIALEKLVKLVSLKVNAPKIAERLTQMMQDLLGDDDY